MAMDTISSVGDAVNQFLDDWISHFSEVSAVNATSSSGPFDVAHNFHRLLTWYLNPILLYAIVLLGKLYLIVVEVLN